MTASLRPTTLSLRGLALSAASCLALALLVGSPARADDANPVLAKVNGVEIHQSDVALAEEELAPSLAQMDPATKKENVLAFLIDMKIVAKAAEDGAPQRQRRHGCRGDGAGSLLRLSR